MEDKRGVEPGDFSISTETTTGAVIVRPVGELDAYTVLRLRDTFDEIADRAGSPGDAGATGLVVDLTGLTFMDSSGLGALVGAKKRVEDGGGWFSVVCVGGPVLRVLTITGLQQALDVRPTLRDALTGPAGTA